MAVDAKTALAGLMRTGSEGMHPDTIAGMKLMQAGLMQAEGVAKMSTKEYALTKLAQLAKL